MKALGELIKPIKPIQAQQPSVRGLSTEWQAKAYMWAEKLGITLSGQLTGRWMKVFKQAHNGRKVLNLGQAYGYVYDHPNLKTQEAKLKMFFYVYENGLKGGENK